MMFKRAFLLTLIIVMFAPNIQAQEADSDAPYIYYYSDDLLAFVIERADGTDSRVFGDGLMALTESANIHVAGPGWSPSGEWFAWTSAQVSNYDWSGYKPYMLSVDGSRRLAMLDHFEHAEMLWSPHEDLLFVGGQYAEPLDDAEAGDDSVSGYLHTCFELVDPAAGAVIAEVEESYPYSSSPPYWSPLEIAWVLDGQYAVAKYAEETQTTFSIFDKAGNITEHIIDLTYENWRRLRPSVSPEGVTAYYIDEALVVENLITGDRQTFEGDPSDDQEIRWSGSGRYGLLWGEHLWLLEPGAGEMRLLQESFELSEMAYLYDRTWQPWSPGGRHALLAAGGELYHLDAETAALTPLTIDVSYNTIWRWRDGARSLVATQADGEPVHYLYDYDLDAGRVTSIETERYLDFANQYFMSPDDRYVAYVHEGAVIYDIEAGTYRAIRPDKDSFYSVPGGEIYWHEDGEWLLIHEDALVAGGGANIRHLGIVHVNGSMRRELGFSWAPGPNTINWLPPQVDIDRLPRAIAKSAAAVPQMELNGSAWWVDLDWSPDSRWLVSSPSSYGTADITLWNLETGEANAIFEDVDIGDDEKIGWVEAGDSYAPEIVARDEPFDRGEPPYIVAASPDGSQFITVEDASQFVVLDAGTGEKIQELGMIFFWFVPVDFSSDGRWLATGRQVRIWDTQTWDIAATLPGPGSAVAFSPDGARLAVGVSWDIQIWDVMALLERAPAEN